MAEKKKDITLKFLTTEFVEIFVLGTIFILSKGIGVGGPEYGNFPLLYVMKISLRGWVSGSKKPQNTLT